MQKSNVVKEVSAAAGPGGISIVENLNKTCDNIDAKDDILSNGGLFVLSMHNNNYFTVIFLSETITLDLGNGFQLEDNASALNQEEGIGRPYRRDIGVQDEYWWFLCMNPLQSALLSDSEFIETDVTFDSCHEYPYLLYVTRFSYVTMKCGEYLLCVQFT